MKTRRGGGNENSSLELKYCERCGALRFRPAGGEQVYCPTCAREMAELPPVSRELDSASEVARPDWATSRSAAPWREDEESENRDLFGGVA